MPLSIGIVGLPNVGKSTLFKTITEKQVDCQNYPFCTIDSNVGVVAVPDERLDKLEKLTNSAKKIYTTIEFVDIAGLVKGANKGEGLGNKFLANIRETNAIIYVLRAFQKKNITSTQSEINPLKEKEILDTELVLSDLETIQKRFDNLEKKVKIDKKEFEKELEVVSKVKKLLEEGSVLIEQNFDEEEKTILKNYQLLTMKPRLYLLNGREEEVTKETIESFEKNNQLFLIIDIESEFEASSLTKEEKEELGLSYEPEFNQLIKKSYQVLDLITFFTTGKDESRAWTIKRGEKAPQAAGTIHSDFEDNFIKANAINWKNLIDVGGFSQAREKGLIRVEGKNYTVEDGDVIEIKHGA